MKDFSNYHETYNLDGNQSRSVPNIQINEDSSFY